MRRIPYIRVKDNRLSYICPRCRNVIPRDLYMQQCWCPSCEHPLNQTAKNIFKVYETVDKDMYKHFIYKYRRLK